MCVRLCEQPCLLSYVCKQCVRLDQDITDSAEIQAVKLRGKAKSKQKLFFMLCTKVFVRAGNKYENEN